MSKATKLRIVKRAAVGLLFLAVLAFITIQFVPVERTNPPIISAMKAPDAVDQILRRSCYDCHSNETRWPWYSRIAPLSWSISDHVIEGRDEMNFSDWPENPRKQAKIRKECWEEIEKGKMPLDKYLWLHWDAELSEEDLKVLKEWSSTP